MDNQKKPRPAGTGRGHTAKYLKHDTTTTRGTAPVERWLARLDRVYQKGPDSWKASCPTDAHPHGDRSAGLCLDIANDGRLLLYCPAGCTGFDIAPAVGLPLRDLYPPSEPGAWQKPADGLSFAKRRELSNDLHTEEHILTTFDQNVGKGIPMAESDLWRVGLAMGLVVQLRRALGVGS